MMVGKLFLSQFVNLEGKNKHAAERNGGMQGGPGKEIVLGIIGRDSKLCTKLVRDSKARTIQMEVS